MEQQCTMSHPSILTKVTDGWIYALFLFIFWVSNFTYLCITVNKCLAAAVTHNKAYWFGSHKSSLSFSQSVLQDQCLELRSQVISLRSQLDTSQAVQRDFVQLSQSLQVHRPNVCSFGQVFTCKCFDLKLKHQQPVLFYFALLTSEH